MKQVGGFLRSRFIRFGAPFIALVVGGSFGLKYFAQIRYDAAKNRRIPVEEAEKHGIKMKKPGEVTLDSEFEKIKLKNLNNWENKRGPRPWEPENPVTQEHLKKGEKLGKSYMREIGMPLPNPEDIE